MQKIKAILFDLGGVILNLDTQKPIDSFITLGADMNLFQIKSAIFEMYECCKISTSDFILSLKKELPEYISEALIIETRETVFIDDTEMHCNAASELGLKTIHTKQVLGTWFFEELKKLKKKNKNAICNQTISFKGFSIFCSSFSGTTFSISAIFAAFISSNSLCL